MLSRLKSFLADRRGNIAMVFGLSLPVLGGATAAAVDLNTWWAAKVRLQAAVDGAALAAAQEFQLASSTSSSVSRTAESYVRGKLADKGPTPTTVTTAAGALTRTVQVDATAQVSPILSRIISERVQYVTATATAKLSSGAPVCMIGLDPSVAGTLTFDSKSQLTADRCAIFSNSAHPQGLSAGKQAKGTAALFCSHGGYQNDRASLSPAPVTDCPIVRDPLATRPRPLVGSCTDTSLTISKSTRMLLPGTYCGGLKVTDKSSVTLLPGIYVILDGALSVDQKSSFTGTNVGLYFVGDKSSLLFDKDSTISLTAPKDGVMAGLLLMEDLNIVAPVLPPLPIDLDLLGLTAGSPPPLPLGAPPMRNYRIISDNARQLLGTVYLPNGRLMIDSKKTLADQSAYTVIVVRRLELFDGPNLQLNANYGATDIPVPAGVGPVPAAVSLAK